jgi:hypothetical protein
MHKTSFLLGIALTCSLAGEYTAQQILGISDVNAQPITFMTFNVRRDGPEKLSRHEWRNRKNLAIETIKNGMADIIGLQEPVATQIQDIASALPGYQWVGKGRGENWFGLSKDEYTPIFYKSDRLTLLDYGTLPLINHQNFLDGKSMAWPRIATGHTRITG